MFRSTSSVDPIEQRKEAPQGNVCIDFFSFSRLVLKTAQESLQPSRDQSTVKNSERCHGLPLFSFLMFASKQKLETQSENVFNDERRKKARREETTVAEFKDWNVLLLPRLIAYADRLA